MDSGFLELFSVFQCTRIRNPKAKINSWISDVTSKNLSDSGIRGCLFHGARDDNNRPLTSIWIMLAFNGINTIQEGERYNRDKLTGRPTFHHTFLIAGNFLSQQQILSFVINFILTIKSHLQLISQKKKKKNIQSKQYLQVISFHKLLFISIKKKIIIISIKKNHTHTHSF